MKEAWISGQLMKLVQAQRRIIQSKKFIGIFLSTIFVVSLGLIAYSYAHKEVMLSDNGDVKTISTFKGTVAELLQEQGIVLAADDKILNNMDERLKDKKIITIFRAFPVTVKADNKKVELMITPMTVADILHKGNIKLSKYDEVSMKLDNLVKHKTFIQIDRIKLDTISEKQMIPFPVKREERPQMDRGQIKVVQAGVNGVKKNFIKVTYKNGKLMKREFLSAVVVNKAQPKVVAFGTRSTVARGGEDLQFRESMYVEATAYSTGSHTATGASTQRGVIAVDPSIIPLGTKVYVEGYGKARALDTGSAIKGNTIDVFLDSSREARNWGRRTVKIYILE